MADHQSDLLSQAQDIQKQKLLSQAQDIQRSKTTKQGHSDILPTIVDKLAQGATAGFADELSGAGEAAGRMVGVQGLGGKIKDMKMDAEGPTFNLDDLKKAYIAGRDKDRAVLKQEGKDNPVTSGIADFAGALISPLNKLMPGSSIARQGAVYGGVQGLGNSDADNFSDLTKDTGKGLALGYGLGKVAQAASPLVEKGAKAISEKAGDFAEKLAARALGAERATVKKMGADKAQEIGRYALDNKLLTPLSSTEDVVARNAAKKAQGGAKMGEVYDAVDGAGASTFNPLDVAGNIDAKIGGFYRSPINRGETNQLENTLESVLMRGDKNIPLSEAQTLKEELSKVANWKNNINITDKEKMAREAYGIVNDAIDEAAKVGAKTIGKEGLQETLSQGKKLYGNASGAETFLNNKVAREQGNQFFGLKDSISGGAGAAIGASIAGPVGAVVGGAIGSAGSKAAGKYGAQTSALAFDKLSKVLSKTPNMAALLEKNPDAYQEVVQSVFNHFGHDKVTASLLPKAASKDSPTKGPDKWANDGAKNIQDHDSSIFSDPKILEQLKSTKKGKDLLIKASDLKPNTKAMDKLVEQLKSANISGGE